MMGLLEVAASLMTFVVSTVPIPKELYALWIGNKFLHEVMQCMGNSGSH